MTNTLPHSVKLEWSILQKQNTTGTTLRRLPHLLKALQYNKETMTDYSQIKLEVDKKARGMNEAIEKSMAWIEEAFSVLEKHKKVACIKHEIEGFKKLLNGQGPLLAHGNVEYSLDYLEKAVSNLVAFDDTLTFNNILDDHGNPCYSNEIFRQIIEWDAPPPKDGIIKHKSKIGQKLVKRLGGGFISAKLCPPALAEARISSERNTSATATCDEAITIAPAEERSTTDELLQPQEIQIPGRARIYDVIRGRIAANPSYPSCVMKVINRKTREAEQNWNELLKSDPTTLLEYLQILSLYSTFKPLVLPLPKESSPKNWQDCEAINYQGRVGYFLNCFRSKDSKRHPHSCEEIHKLIEIFLNMVEIRIAKTEKHSEKQKSAKKISPYELPIKNFILEERRGNPTLSREVMVDKVLRALANDTLKVPQGSPKQKEPARSTIKKWDREVDPVKDMNEKLKRKKNPNR